MPRQTSTVGSAGWSAIPVKPDTWSAFYLVSGEVEVIGQAERLQADRLVVLRPGTEVVLHALGLARRLLLGGEPLEGRRHIYWNFVSSRPERILQTAELASTTLLRNPGRPILHIAARLLAAQGLIDQRPPQHG